MPDEENPALGAERARVAQEEKEREKIYAQLEKLEGFQKLNERQQRYIKNSFYVDQRARRLENLDSMDDYKASDHHMDFWYCHAAAAAVEEAVAGPRTAPYDGSFFEGNYVALPKHRPRQHVENLIDKAGFPCVVLMSQNETYEHGLSVEELEDDQIHSFLALGRNEAGEIMIWEKQGLASPYRLVPLQKVFEDYDYSPPFDYSRYFWAARPLRSAEEIAKKRGFTF